MALHMKTYTIVYEDLSGNVEVYTTRADGVDQALSVFERDTDASTANEVFHVIQHYVPRLTMKIHDLPHLQQILAAGPYAWPGGYPLYFVMADCEPMSFEAVLDNKAEVFGSFDHDPPLVEDRQWRPAAVEINWESTDLTCAHTSELIEAAYDKELNHD